jgi:hypothetical protein
MSTHHELPLSATHQVRDACLCLHVQRAARALARHFDEVFRPLGLTHGQFSLLTSLNRPEPPTIGSVAVLLAWTAPHCGSNLANARAVKASVDLKISVAGLMITAPAAGFGARRSHCEANADIERRISRGNADDVRAALRSLS